MALKDCWKCNKAYLESLESQERCPLCGLTELEAAARSSRWQGYRYISIYQYPPSESLGQLRQELADNDAYWAKWKKKCVSDIMLKLFGTIGR